MSAHHLETRSDFLLPGWTCGCSCGWESDRYQHHDDALAAGRSHALTTPDQPDAVASALALADQYRPSTTFDNDELDEMCEALIVLGDEVTRMRSHALTTPDQPGSEGEG